MHFESSGSGAPPIVFVHGFSCDLSDWQLQVDALSAKHRIVACDLRGHGQTRGDAHECTIENYGADVAALVASLAISPAVLVGHSLGCRVVLEAARTHPERVAALVLVDGSCTASGDPAAAEQKMQDKIRTMGYPAFAEERFHDMFPVPNANAEALIARSRKLPASIGAALFPRMSRWDAEYMDVTLASLGMPIMLIQSTYLGPTLKRESLAPGASSAWLDRVRSAVPHARIEIISGVGHFTQLEAADEVNRLIEDFLAARS